MRLARALPGFLVLCGCFAVTPLAGAAEVSLFNGLPHGIEVVRILEGGREQRPWSGPMEPGSRWRLILPAGADVEFRHEGRAVASLEVGPAPKQGHVIRLPGVKGPVPPPPPRGQASEFPNWRLGTAVKPVPVRRPPLDSVTAAVSEPGPGSRVWR